jgi:gamma-glutamylaminecyclotransferase
MEKKTEYNGNVLLFVYGTLMSGFGNNRLLSESFFVGKAETIGEYSLYASGIPYVYPDKPTSKIKGELWEVTPQQLPRIDQLEGHPRWYNRQLIDVMCNDTLYKAWLYFMPDADITRLELIKSGDYREYRY